MPITAIVAIPEATDPVWKVSSEKIPHLTLLALGDQSKNPNLPGMVDFVQHIADQSLTRFGLSVDRRDILGEKDADVLFFEKDRAIRDVATARGYMLTQADILAAYKSVPQFEPWVPHLTLGFPETPAKKGVQDDFQIHWVQFDKIAVWTGATEFEGPTFDLKKETWDWNMDIAMSAVLDKVLSHHGVKGMKWGVHRSRSSRAAAKAHPDAARATKLKEKAKGGKTDALSNEELQHLVQRLNLEKQFATLRPPSAGDRTKKLLAETLLSVGKQQVNKAVSDQASKQITRLLAGASK